MRSLYSFRILSSTAFFATFLVTMIVSTSVANAQLDLDVYKKFKQEHKDMTADDLLREYPAGMFRRYAPTDLSAAQFGQQVSSTLQLTPYEKSLVGKYSFMVSERLSYPTYNAAFLDAYIKDMPLYISSDAILHALHRSYDNMLKHMEMARLSTMMKSALDTMRAKLSTSIYSEDPLVQKAVRDADVYLTVASALLSTKGVRFALTQFPENSATVSKILSGIADEDMQRIVLFSDASVRDYDFSQFKPRGHYTDNESLELYFKCLMWLGRTEIYIVSPVTTEVSPTHVDIRRQCMLSVILADLATSTTAAAEINGVDAMITRFVGEQDNLTLPSLAAIVQAYKGNGSQSGMRPEDLLNDVVLKNFQESVRASGGEQKILSQLLYGDDTTDVIQPAVAFMLLGQRFILDSYILGNVVYDKVLLRLMPSPLDAMFALGNDAAAQLLSNELQVYDYAPNLAGLRYLTSTLSTSYWETSLYSTWLNSIRALNPQPNRESLPMFMRTGAWAQKQLNTQLTSWAELRHDNLLYAKQSYTGGIGCLYPAGYVEPVPALYTRVAAFAQNLYQYLGTIEERENDEYFMSRLKETLLHISSTCQMLESMSEKEIAGIPFSELEKAMIDGWIVKQNKTVGCDRFDEYDGVYPNLYYGEENRCCNDAGDFIIADVHTQPTDDNGNLIGRVLHVATGKVNTAVVVAADPSDGCVTAYTGPVGSYYERITEGFMRLSDEEWVKLYADSTVPRPAWVYTYLANANGESPGEPQTLTTTGVSEPLPVSASSRLSVVPNPTSGTTTIAFEVPPSNAGRPVTIQVVNAQGNVVSTLQSNVLVAGNYVTRWDGLTTSGAAASSGTYYVRVQMGESNVVQKVVVLK
ncbi:MAG: DUF3160 domain-containing protein [bacterium]|nr:DUF3160 domain-containing protein [bacterium]